MKITTVDRSGRTPLIILPAIQLLGFALLALAMKTCFSFGHFQFLAQETIALYLALTGAVLLLSSGALFRRNRTTINPYRPDKTTKLVIKGWYRWTRNPMYLAFLLILTGWSVYLANVFSLLVIPLFGLSLKRFNIIPEEQALHRKFGKAYEDYQKRVRRWL